MQNPESPAPQRTGPMLAALFGFLGIGLLALLCLIVFGGLAYLRGYSLPTIFASATLLPTGTPLSTLTPASTSTPTPSLAFTATQTPTASPTLTATIVFHTPTFTPTHTKTTTPYPTRTRTPTPTKPPVSTTLNDVQYEFNYNAWIGLAGNPALGKGMRCSSGKGELLAFETSKNAVLLNLFFYRGPNQGKVNILVDDVVVETLDLYKATPQYRFEWAYSFPKPKQAHKIKIVVLHEKRNASAGYQVCFDGFKAGGNTFTDDDSYNIRYDAWSGASNGKALFGGYRLSATADSSVTFTVHGKSFQWVTAFGPNYGQADVYVDGQFVATVDLYLPVQKWQQPVSFKNLGSGNHTVTIIVLGQHNSASNGNGVVFDGIIIP